MSRTMRTNDTTDEHVFDPDTEEAVAEPSKIAESEEGSPSNGGARPGPRPKKRRRERASRYSSLPQLVTVDAAAEFLCTSRHAIYAMLERGQLPAPIRIGRRVLLVQDELLDWLDQKRAPSL